MASLTYEPPPQQPPAGEESPAWPRNWGNEDIKAAKTAVPPGRQGCHLVAIYGRVGECVGGGTYIYIHTLYCVFYTYSK
jgi:hypothetical protein